MSVDTTLTQYWMLCQIYRRDPFPQRREEAKKCLRQLTASLPGKYFRYIDLGVKVVPKS